MAKNSLSATANGLYPKEILEIAGLKSACIWLWEREIRSRGNMAQTQSMPESVSNGCKISFKSAIEVILGRN
jgi:hypothetical protein